MDVFIDVNLITSTEPTEVVTGRDRHPSPEFGGNGIEKDSPCEVIAVGTERISGDCEVLSSGHCTAPPSTIDTGVLRAGLTGEGPRRAMRRMHTHRNS